MIRINTIRRYFLKQLIEMVKIDSQNPLSDAQREKAGSQTFEKYSYQYHWALYRILTEQENLREYAVFVEFHEDVVISDSLNANDARFEFNQVKTTKTKFNTNQLVKKKKNGNTVLGKLISSGLGKSFKDKISSLNLVALNHFDLELKKKGVKLNKITINDLSSDQLKNLEDALKDELSISSIPANLQFIVPDLSEKNFQNDVIAAIAKLILTLFPGSHCSPVDIYRILIDEINRKGVITYDYNLWDELLSKKALTSLTVTKVINEFTNIKNEALIEVQFNEICSELGLTTIERKLIRRPFTRYRQSRISNNSTNQLDTTKAIEEKINDNLNDGVTDINDLITNVSSTLHEKIKRQFTSVDELRSAIICEYIMMA